MTSILNLLLTGLMAFSSGLVERTLELDLPAKDASDAKRVLFDQAIQQISIDEVIKIVGEKKFEQNRTQILKLIESGSSQFIPLSKTSDVEQTPTGYKMKTTARIDVQSLQSLLQSKGLLYDNKTANFKLVVDGPLTILAREQIKDAVRNQFYNVKSISEKNISTESVTYNLECAEIPVGLTKNPVNLSVEGFQFEYYASDASQVILKAKPTQTK